MWAQPARFLRPTRHVARAQEAGPTNGAGIAWGCRTRINVSPIWTLEGIDIAVLFGTFIGLGAAASIEDPGLGMAVSVAYNNWLAAYCKTLRRPPQRYRP